MASTSLARGAAGAQLQGVAAPRVARPARLARLVCRAEESKAEPKAEPPKAEPKAAPKAETKAVTKAADRTNDFLFFSSKASWGYLDGSRPGDFGFDPLGLLEPANRGGFINPEWLTYSEIIHCRFAMLGAAGMIGPEILGKANLIPQETNLAWFTTGVIPPAGTYGNYWTDPWSLFWIEILAMQFAELRRWQDFRKPGSMGKQYFLGLENSLGGSGNPSYPGGSFFNVFNLGGESEASLNKLKTNEVRNGRLAMLAVLGYGAQATITRVGPFQNLLDHLSDPTGNNILANFSKVYGQ